MFFTKLTGSFVAAKVKNDADTEGAICLNLFSLILH